MGASEALELPTMVADGMVSIDDLLRRATSWAKTAVEFWVLGKWSEQRAAYLHSAIKKWPLETVAAGREASSALRRPRSLGEDE